MSRTFIRFLPMAILLIATGCTKENVLPDVQNARFDTTMAILKVTGDFFNGPYGVVTGKAKVYAKGDSLLVALENFASSNGPDLKVYVSMELSPVNFVNLGSLKTTSGNQVYHFPVGTNLSQYKYVLIYCQQYKHLFGAATL